MHSFLRSVIAFALVLSIATSADAQFVITSTSNPAYTITVTISAASLVNRICRSADFDYQPIINYNVAFSSATAPALSYLAGSLYCGSGASDFVLPSNGGAGTLTGSRATYSGTVSCSNATPTSIGCNAYSLNFSGPNIPTGSAFVISNAIALPIEILRFDARNEQAEVYLIWETVSAEKASGLRLESSADAIAWNASSIPVSRREGAGRQIFEAREPLPAAGYRYYRLCHTDPDGTRSYSKTLAVRAKNDLSGVIVSPNPATGNTVTLSNLESPADWDLTLLNPGGQSLRRQRADTQIPISDLSPGLYIIRLCNRTSGETTNLRFRKI